MKFGEVNTQMLTFVMLDVLMYYTLPQFLSNSLKIFQLLACIYKQSRLCFKTAYIKCLAWKRLN